MAARLRLIALLMMAGCTRSPRNHAAPPARPVAAAQTVAEPAPEPVQELADDDLGWPRCTPPDWTTVKLIGDAALTILADARQSCDGFPDAEVEYRLFAQRPGRPDELLGEGSFEGDVADARCRDDGGSFGCKLLRPGRIALVTMPLACSLDATAPSECASLYHHDPLPPDLRRDGNHPADLAAGEVLRLWSP